MKRIISLVLALVLALSLAACTKAPKTDPTTVAPTEAPTEAVPTATGVDVKLATLQGPTGMGMAYLLNDAKEGKTLNNYEATICAGPDEITGKIVSGEFDIAALPTNAAATLYNKSNGKVKLLALNTECVLYILEKGDTIKSMADLKGKTIYVSGQGSTPEFILNYLLEASGLKVGEDVKLDFTYTTHNDLVAFAASGKADVVLLPEPAVTALLAQNKDMKVALSLDDVWDKVTDGTDYEDAEIAMGCVVVNTAFAEAHPDAVKAFLYEYEKSIDLVKDEKNIDQTAEIIAQVGIVAKAPVAKMALPRCNITFETGAEMREEVEGFYKVLFDAQPNSVGGQLPDDNFYYAG
jgi:NitT/TauT family transport system substrate-binding protein